MKRRLPIILAGLLLVIAALAGYRMRPSRNEPTIDGKYASEWIQQLAHSDNDVLDRDQAIRSLTQLDAAAVPALVEALQKQDSFYTRNFDSFGAHLPGFVLKLAPAPEPSLDVRRAAARQLGELGSSARAAIPALCNALKDPDRVVRGYAYTTLNQLSAKPEDIINGLVGALHSPDPDIRVFAAGELGLFVPESKSAILDLTGALEDTDTSVRLNVVHTLGLMGSSAKAASPTLAKMLNDPLVEIRFNVATTLWQIDQSRIPEVVPVLVEILKSDDDSLVATCIRSLGDIGPAAKAAIPSLEKLATRTEVNLRRMATEALIRIDPLSVDKSG